MLDFAIALARRAGNLLLDVAQQAHTVRTKSTPFDLVTEADVASERLIVDAIRERFPDHAILAEEGTGQESDRGPDEIEHLWLVDPLDGTTNFAHGYPTWAVSLALAEWGQVRLAVTLEPLRDELTWAERGQGAWLRTGDTERRLQVSNAPALEQALLATGFSYNRTLPHQNNLREFGAIMPQVQGVRRAGAAVLDMAHVAMGRLDGYWELLLKPWDWAAGWLLIEAAGGRVTDLDGNPWHLEAQSMVATNGRLHDELLDALQSAWMDT
jgi:myo-inositol-1(or 4)-monophosphatase